MQLHKGQTVWLGNNPTQIPRSWRGLKAAVVGPTRGGRYKLSIAPDQPHAGEFCTLGYNNFTTSNPYQKK
jgi:hypothetical protein